MANLSNFTEEIYKANVTMREIEMPIEIIIYGSFFYVLIFLMGLLGNTSVIFVLMKERGLRNFTNYLLANLSIADLLVLIACVPSGLHDLFAKERWYLGEFWCYMVVFIENCMGTASLLSILSITLERFYVICRPLKVKSVMTQSRTLKLIFLIWCVAITINLPYIYLTEYRLEPFFDKNTMEYKCITPASGNWSFYYIIIVTYAIYFFIGIVLLCLYYKISKYLKNSMNMVSNNVSNGKSNVSLKLLNDEKSTSTNQTNTLNVSSNGGEDYKELTSHLSSHNNSKKSSQKQGSIKSSRSMRNSSSHGRMSKININNDFEKYVKPRRQLIVMLMCVMVVFYVCLFPLKIWALLLMFIGYKPYFLRVIQLKQYWYISITVRIFFYLNSSINPILYNFLSKKFRKAFKNMLLYCLCFGSSGSELMNGINSNLKDKRLEDMSEFKRNSVFVSDITKTCSRTQVSSKSSTYLQI